MELFDYLKNLWTKRIPLDTGSPYHVNLWMVNRFISGSPIGFPVAQELNLYLSRLPNWASGMFLYRTLPYMSRAPWLAYNKKQQLPYPEELIAKYAECFACSNTTAVQYIALIEKKTDPYKLFGLKRTKNAKNSKKKKAGKKSKKNERLPRGKKSRR